MSGIARKAKAVWKGTGKEGKGMLDTQSGVMKGQQYGFNSRFENGADTNPEELLAAAHAGCFTMAFAFALNKNGFTADQIETDCAVTVAPDGDGFSITKSALTMTAKIPTIDEKKFQELANAAKAGCPVSKLYRCEITLSATLSSQSKAA